MAGIREVTSQAKLISGSAQGTQENCGAASQYSLWVWSASIFYLPELSSPILEGADIPHQLRLTLQEGWEEGAGQDFLPSIHAERGILLALQITTMGRGSLGPTEPYIYGSTELYWKGFILYSCLLSSCLIP